LKIRRDRRKLDPSPMTRYGRRAAAEFNNEMKLKKPRWLGWTRALQLIC
jgi:hypothetical protein